MSRPPISIICTVLRGATGNKMSDSPPKQESNPPYYALQTYNCPSLINVVAWTGWSWFQVMTMADLTVCIHKHPVELVARRPTSISASPVCLKDCSGQQRAAAYGIIDHSCQMAIARFLDRMCLAPLRCAASFDPFLSLDCAPTPSTLAQSMERKGSNFAA